jgi:hypothetical protein
MKQLSAASLRNFAALVILCLLQTVVMAQDTSNSTSTRVETTTTTKETWYAEPWVWVVGGAVLILILVALLRGNSSRRTDASRTDKVTVTRSTSTDSDV